MIAIADYAFAGNKFTRVRIPDYLTVIGAWAFVENSITSVDIGISVRTIGASAFEKNQLTKVTIPSSVTIIGDGAFLGNLDLTTVTLSQALYNLIAVDDTNKVANLAAIFGDHNGAGDVVYQLPDGNLITGLTP